MNTLSEYHKRKQKRTEYYLKYVYKWKLRDCGACNGSGYYDSHGSPKCQGCEPPGSGKERYKPDNLKP